MKNAQKKSISLKILTLQVVCLLAVLFCTFSSLPGEVVLMDENPIKHSVGWWAVSAIPVLAALFEIFHRGDVEESM